MKILKVLSLSLAAFFALSQWASAQTTAATSTNPKPTTQVAKPRQAKTSDVAAAGARTTQTKEGAVTTSQGTTKAKRHGNKPDGQTKSTRRRHRSRHANDVGSTETLNKPATAPVAPSVQPAGKKTAAPKPGGGNPEASANLPKPMQPAQASHAAITAKSAPAPAARSFQPAPAQAAKSAPLPVAQQKTTTVTSPATTGSDQVVGKDAKGRVLYRGPKGGEYYINASGNKEYVTPDKQ